MTKNLFDIVTLSDNGRRLSQTGGNVDPLTILTAGTAFLSTIFPNIFGSGRKLLTNSDWLQLYPGSGYWSNRLRTYLASHIQYSTDWANIQPFTDNFVYENLTALKGNNSIATGRKNLMEIIKQEQIGQGEQSPGGAGYGAGGGNALLYIGIGVAALMLLSKSKKRSTRKK